MNINNFLSTAVPNVAFASFSQYLHLLSHHTPAGGEQLCKISIFLHWRVIAGAPLDTDKILEGCIITDQDPNHEFIVISLKLNFIPGLFKFHTLVEFQPHDFLTISD